eukprot:COSAG01_NODE_31559_length_595_cov_1.467742_1_plen_73_part_10
MSAVRGDPCGPIDAAVALALAHSSSHDGGLRCWAAASAQRSAAADSVDTSCASMAEEEDAPSMPGAVPNPMAD